MTTAAAAATSTSRSPHLPALDGLRGVAILLVCFYHYASQAGQLVDGTSLASRLAGRCARLGMHGVDLFFVLSGFLITRILLESKDTRGYFRNFYARRTLRIFPLYYGFLFLLLVIAPRLAPHSSMLAAAGQDQAWLWTYTADVKVALEDRWLFCGTSATVCGQGIELNHLWSLAVEEHFYFFWPLIVWFCDRRALLQTCVGLSLLALAVRLLLRDDWHAVYALTPCRIDALVAGAVVAVLEREPAWSVALRRYGWPLALLAAIAFAVIVGLPGELEARSPAVRATAFTFTSILAAAAMVSTLDAPATSVLGRIMGSSTLRTIGKYSYGLYVFHDPLRPVWGWLIPPPTLARTLHSPALALVVYFVLATAGSLAVAWASYHLFEKRFLALKRYFESDPRRAPAETVAPT
jgi:peptidoglycan/LPS O-acetylase OafA/YrhL